MEKVPTIKRIKMWIAGIGFRLFIWGNETTEEDYWEEIYQQERNWRRNNHLPS